MEKPGPTAPRWLKFAYYYINLACASEAIKEAGYTSKNLRTIRVRGAQLLAQRNVQDAIASFNRDRHQHAELTYHRLCDLSKAAYDWAMKCLASPSVTIENKTRAVMAAGHSLERVARAEGLVQGGQSTTNPATVNLTIQQIVQRIKTESLVLNKPADAPARPAIAGQPVTFESLRGGLVGGDGHDIPAGDGGNGRA